MNRVTSAVGGGVAATAALSLLLLLLDVEMRSAFGVFEAIARFAGVPDAPVLGFVVFLLAGVVAWPLAFLAVASRLDRDPPVVGMALAVGLWAAFVVLGRGDISGALLAVYASFTLLAHLAYGYVLGAVYEWLSRLDGGLV